MTDETKPQDSAAMSPASAGSHNTHMVTARLSAANTWVQEEIKRQRLTDAERKWLEWLLLDYSGYADEGDAEAAGAVATLQGLLERLGGAR